MAKKATKKKATKKKVAKTTVAVDTESSEVEFLRISFGEVDEEANYNDARECINPQQTCFVVAAFKLSTWWALIQVGNDVLVLDDDELSEELESCFIACAKLVNNSGRSDEEVMWLSMMKSAHKDEPWEIFDNMDSFDPDDPTVDIVTDRHTGFYGTYDGADFCLIESCSLEAKMSGERVIFDGTSYEPKDLYELISDYDGSRREPSPEVAEFRSKHNYEAMKCILGYKEEEDDWDDDDDD